MTTGVACTAPILQFFTNAGTPCIGGSIMTQVGGVNTATYQDSALAIPLPNPIPLNSRGEISSQAGTSQQLFLTPNTVYTFTYSDANGNQIWVANYVNGVQVTLTQSSIGAIFYPQSAGEAAAGVIPTNYYDYYGDVRRYGASADSNTANAFNQNAFTQAANANAGFYPVIIDNNVTAGGFYGGLTGPIPLPAGSHVIMRNGAEVRWASNAATGPTYSGAASAPGFNVLGNNVRIEGKGILSGSAGAGVYASNQIGIIAIGASATAPYVSLYVGPQIELRWWGSDGIAIQYVNDFDVSGCTIHDCGYAGMHALTCTRGVFSHNEVYNITPGTSGNAYGFSGTYSGTPTNSRSDANHFCISIDVHDNFIHDIPLWEGIDFHGAFDCDIHDNRVYNCYTAIQCASGLGSGGYYWGGENNKIHDNIVDISQYNGSATTVATGPSYGITVNGGMASVTFTASVGGAASGTLSATFQSGTYPFLFSDGEVRSVTVSGTAATWAGNLNAGTITTAAVLFSAHVACQVFDNTIFGYGYVNGSGPPNGYGIQATGMDSANISGNTFRNWQGYGIYSAGSIGGQMNNNVFMGVGGSVSSDACIYIPSQVTAWQVEGNTHVINTGTAAHFGACILSANTLVAKGNNFSSAQTAPFGNTVGGSLLITNFMAQAEPVVFGSGYSTTALGVGQSSTAQVVASSGTIGAAGNQVNWRVNPAGNVTGVIMQPGTLYGQMAVVTNVSAYSVTMAAAGTSNVADGTSCVISANTQKTFFWDVSTGYWFHS